MFDTLKTCREEHSEILEAMPLAFLSLDESLHVLSCNRTAEQFLGATREELVGKKLWPSHQKEQAEAVFKRKYSEALSENKSVSFQAFSSVAAL